METKEMSHASLRKPKKRPSVPERETEANNSGSKLVTGENSLQTQAPLLSRRLPSEELGKAAAFLKESGPGLFLSIHSSALQSRNFHTHMRVRRGATFVTTVEVPSSSSRGRNWLLININPPKQSHAQETWRKRHRTGAESPIFFLLHLEN